MRRRRLSLLCCWCYKDKNNCTIIKRRTVMSQREENE